MSDVPALRLRTLNHQQAADQGHYVLYWMVANRRAHYNFSLQRAVHWAKHYRKPLVILETLHCDEPWASARFHHFVIQGMADNAAHFAQKNVCYYPYWETQPGRCQALFEQLAGQACIVVSDDFPDLYWKCMLEGLAPKVSVPLEVVDSNGLLPLRAAEKVFARAFDFRRFLQKNLVPHLAEMPARDALARVKLPHPVDLAAAVRKRWPAAEPAKFLAAENRWQTLPIDASVLPVATAGGSTAATKTLKDFLRHKLPCYHADRNQPEVDVTSGLSPYLHFGHISTHQIFTALSRQENWSPGNVAEKATGSSTGWWGTRPEAESFLDELVTWREVGYNLCWQRDDFDKYESLPAWAQKTLAEHADDARESTYTTAEFDAARTHDPLWNAAQQQLVREGRMHNYLRMLWGKKILEWSASPQQALDTMIELNNKYALDGRNPNSYSGIFWVLGRYDRAWGPERPIFGKIRYMSSKNTARKVKVKHYIEKYSA